MISLLPLPQLHANATPITAALQALVPANATWKYLDNGSDQGTAWRNPGFNDSAWKSGPAELGYGDGNEATKVSYGPDINHKFITTYFRHTFNVSNPASVSALSFDLLRDDGAVVYLNGSEVFRSNMPSTTIGYKTVASAAQDGSVTGSIPASKLVAGANVLAVEIHQFSGSSSDISFSLALNADVTAAPTAAPTQPAQPTAAATLPAVPQALTTSVLSAWGSTWKYLDNGSDQGTAWRGVSFNDSTWKSGPAELGYGDGSEATKVSFGSSSSSKYITTYFRQAFTVSNPAAVSALSFKLLRDDGAVVYLNGSEVIRSNMPSTTIGYKTTASAALEDTVTGTISPTKLVAGTNVLAVEIHQYNGSSSDISFNFELTAQVTSGSVPQPTATPLPTATAAPTTQPTPAPTTAPVSGTLSTWGSTWKYLDNGSDQGTAWRSTSFNDSTWKSGPAELGYGDGNEATKVSFGSSSTSKYITTYFRQAFTVSNPASVSALSLKLLRDDGAIVFLNGSEVFRSNMPSTACGYRTLASSNSEATVTGNVDASKLVAGTNVLAVEIHQDSVSSSDISFNLELKTGTSNPGSTAPTPTPTAQPTAQPTPPTTSTGKSWYVAPNGSSSGSGSQSSPWNLTTALAHPSAVQPGDTLWLRGGTYGSGGNTQYKSALQGVSGKPITVRSYPGEQAVINGGIIVNGDWSIFWGLEITNTDTDRVSAIASSDPSDISREFGFYVFGSNTKFINNVVHDQLGGFGIWKDALNTEAYGNVVFNNGWKGPDRVHGHGIYTQNDTGTKRFVDNIILNNFSGYSMHVYTENATINGFYFEGNTSLNGEFLVGGLQPSDRITAVENNFILSRATFGYKATGNGTITVKNNTFTESDANAVEMKWWKTATFTGNTVVNGSSKDVYYMFPSSPSGYNWNSNSYYDGGSSPFSVNDSSKTWDGWRSATGFDSSSKFGSGTPGGVNVIVRKNDYEDKRGNVIIYNWAMNGSVSVDISALGFQTGDTYVIHNAQNYNETISGTYNGSPISIPMNSWSVAKPIGWGSALYANTLPKYGAFVISHR